MKIVIFSDTHLTTEFDQQLFEKLKATIESADQVIINGDFWDGFLISFDDFVRSDWQKLFPLLRKKHTIYIYGNHDSDWMSDTRVSLFSVQQATRYHFQSGKHSYFVEHGHLVHQSIITVIASLLPHALVTSINIWIHHQRKNHTLIGKLTEQIESYADAIGDKQLHNYARKMKATNKSGVYVFGHTHITFFSKNENYINPGRFSVQTPMYVLIDKEVCLV